jgi:Eco57I restriction-modification methylase
MNPFHWRLKFSEVLSVKDGFDIIIGNPPYIERRNLDYPTNMLETNKCANTYAYFFEVSLKILKLGGYIVFIVPIASICTDRMIPLQKLLTTSCKLLYVSNYDDRPGKIFPDINDSRSSIVIGKKKENPDDETIVYTTKYNRWHSSKRSELFTNLEFVNSSEVISPGIIPKIGKEMEVKLLSRLMNESRLSEYLIEDPQEITDTNVIWYHNAPRYWIRAMDFMPTFQSAEDEVSSDLKKIGVNGNTKLKKIIISVLNSSLFYWFYTICSDAQHLNLREIKNFGINLDNLSTDNSDRLVTYCDI